jgi:transcriptional regulator with XRE-family HTH domain
LSLAIVVSGRLAALRKARGFSLRVLSAATKIHYVRLHHAEHGRELTYAELTRVARVLGVDVVTLTSAAPPIADGTHDAVQHG